MSDENIRLSFDSHGGMNRVAMKWGVPYLLLIALAFFILVSLVAGIYFFGWFGLAAPVPFVLMLFAIKIMCALDDRALRRFRFVLRRRYLNKKYGRHLLLTPRNPEWSKKHARRVLQENILSGK
ncbi:VirB3 family type IV secretion system protein [Erwinia amylovora]|nr:VirB3 family type IV secretion system protein [Erwinia amylovora]UDJ88601.1 VirB3 family type IV secretion system protein [Erwinia amylovora]